MDNPLEVSWWAHKLGGVGVSGNFKGRVDSVRLMLYSDLSLSESPKGGLSKGTMASASTSVWERAAPPALIPKPDISSLNVSGAFRAALPALGLRVSLSKSMHKAPYEDHLDSRSPPFYSAVIC